MMSQQPNAPFPSTRSTPSIISAQSVQQPFPSLHPAVPHHTLAFNSSPSSASPSTSSSFPSSLSSLFTPRTTLLLSSLALTSSALLLYHLSHRYTLHSSYPFLRPRPPSPLSDPLTGVHALAELRRLSSAHILIPSPATFFPLRARLLRDGPAHLQLITDFDHTLTSYSSLSSHGTLEASSRLPPHYSPKVKALFEHYYPIEMDHTIPPHDKTQHMIDWWEAAHALLISHQFHSSFITSAVTEARQRSRLQLRDGARETLSYAVSAGVPVLVFSAGLGDCIDEFLKQEGLASPGVDVVSNWMRFDDGGVLVGFEADLIHSLNKDYSHVQRQRERGAGVVQGMQAPKRKNVLLLGDSVGDVRMVHGLDGLEVLMRVGFINGEPTEAKMARYKEVYDVLICDHEEQQGSMQFVLDLLHSIVEPRTGLGVGVGGVRV